MCLERKRKGLLLQLKLPCFDYLKTKQQECERLKRKKEEYIEFHQDLFKIIYSKTNYSQLTLEQAFHSRKKPNYLMFKE